MVIGGIDASAALAAAYAVFLGLTALGLEWLARQAHRRSERFEVFGFQYHAEVDTWECPTGKHLHRTSGGADRRTVVYRAPAPHCNCCPIRSQCTDSDYGRTIERRVDSWLDSEVRKFHVGLSLALVLLAVLIVAIELVVHPRGADRLLLLAALAVIALPGLRVAQAFFSHTM